MMYQQVQQQQIKVNMKKKEDHRTRPIEEERLEIVDLSGLSLESLPNPSINLACICKLDLSNNNLQSIPESLIARLLNVVVLDVHSNQLNLLPNSIGCLSKLKVLNVSGNLIEYLPKTIENCREKQKKNVWKYQGEGHLENEGMERKMSISSRSLEDLTANFNNLSKLPDTMGFELINLKKLSVNSNKLVFLPRSITHLTSLRVLDVRLNCLRSLPEDLENLANLQVLNIAQNFQYLEILPYSIGLLFSLVELDISYNKISNLPDSIGCLKKLQKLRVEGNPLVSPPLEVIEQGIHAVKEYLSEKMTSGYNTKKKSWVGKLVKYSTFNVRNTPSREERQGFILLDQYRSIEGLASPRHVGMFSPRRLFSPRTYFSR